jgi:uncharacterized MAPEG superfamily protein
MNPFNLYAALTVILFFKMAAISIVQGIARSRANAFTLAEDAKFFAASAPVAQEVPMVQRAARAWRNDLENIPIFLFLALIYVTALPSLVGAAIYFTIFAVARIAHTIFFLNAIQPWRTISYTVGALTAFALAIHIIVGVVFA